MSPDEVAFLQNWGEALLWSVVDSAVCFVCYGMVLTILVPTLLVLWPRNPTRTWRSLSMFMVNLVCLLTATIIFAGQTCVGWLYIKSPGILAEYHSLDAGLRDFWVKMFVPETLPFWMNPFAVVTSDLVVIWRVWHLQGGIRWLRMSIPILLLSATAISLLLSNVYGLTFEEWLRTNLTDPQSTGITFGNIGDALSLATNLVTTILVGLRLWEERRLVTRYIRERAAFSFAERILLFLVEFGVIFCILQFLSLVFTTVFEHTNQTGFAFRVALECVYKFQRAFATVYPTLVIFLVRAKHTFMNDFGSLHLRSTRPTTQESHELRVLKDDSS